MLVSIDPPQELRVAKSEDRPFARHGEIIQHRARIDARIPREDIDDAAQFVYGHAVCGAEDLHVGRVARGGEVLRIDHVVAVEEVRVLVAEAGAQVTGRRSAGVVRGHRDPGGFFVRDANSRVDLAGVVSGLQRHAHLLGRVLVHELGVLADRARVRGGAFFQRRQARPDVLFVEKAVALYLHAPDPRLDHAQTHLAGTNVLLGNAHAHRVVAAAGVGLPYALPGRAQVP